MDPTASVLFSHFTSAALVVYIIQAFKNAKWFPWLQNDGQIILKRGVSIVGALAAHTGINYAWHANLGTTGGYQLILNIPPLAVLAEFIWRWAGQFVMQELVYRTAVNQNAQSAVVPIAPAKT